MGPCIVAGLTAGVNIASPLRWMQACLPRKLAFPPGKGPSQRPARGAPHDRSFLFRSLSLLGRLPGHVAIFLALVFYHPYLASVQLRDMWFWGRG